MKPGQASRTAEYAAGFRALESFRRPARSRLFDDPFAVHFLAPKLQRLVRLSGLPMLGPLVRGYVERNWPGAMTSGVARTRLIDDLLLASMREGISQVVLLGAGFDCRASRLPEMASCRMVEIDHPSTQAVKKERLQRLLGSLPNQVTWLAADLTREPLADVWEKTGLEKSRRVFVLWEGVTHYLGEDAVNDCLRNLAKLIAPGSRVLFTYLHRGLLDDTVQFDGAHLSMKQVAGEGEPWKWGMDPAQLPEYLAERGFDLMQDSGADEYRARYWGERGRQMRGFSFYRVALAQVQDK